MVGIYPQYKINKVKIYKYKDHGLKEKGLTGDYINDINFEKKLFTVLNHEWYHSKKRFGYFYCVPKVEADEEEQSELISLSFEAFTHYNAELIARSLASIGF